MNKKVLFVTTVIRTVEAFLIPHIRYFLNKDYEVGVAANTQDSNLENLKELGAAIHHVPFSRVLIDKGNLISYKVIKRIIKHYHILHLHTPIASFITRMASSNHHDVIYTVHGFHFNENEMWLKNFLFLTAEKIAGLKTNKLIVTNTDDIAVAQKIVSTRKIHYVHGVGLDTHNYDPAYFSEKEKQDYKLELGLNSNIKVITHIAEFNNNKRQMDIVDACDILKDKIQNFVVFLIGNGENLDAVQKYIQDRHLDTYIKCLGFRVDIPRILSITDIGLLVSIREGLPRSVMEMMAMKVPVIATNIRGNRDLIVNGENGYLVPIKDPLQIAEKCFILLTDEGLAKQFGELGRKKIESRFSIEEVLQQMELIYKDLAKGNITDSF
ncbi:MAG: glycosyltransferase family 4 protein [Thermoanaerobacterium sp.]|nr:glycosyltransferase family 4 protein [Thermoanaerobacterium sp.]